MLALFVFICAVSAARQCWFPDGTAAPNDTTPCNESAESSHCCGRTDICLSNGYCWDQDAKYYNRMVRAACTDKSWTSEACPQRCRDVVPSGAVLVSLAEDTEEGGYCCRGYNLSSSLCTDANDGSFRTFDIGRGVVVVNRTDGTTWYGTGPVISPFGNGTLDDVFNGSTVAAETTVTAASAQSGKKTNIAPVAAGIAVPLGVLFLAALAAAAVFYRKNRRLKRTISELSTRAYVANSYPDSAAQPQTIQSHNGGPYDSPVEVGRYVEADGQNDVKELPSITR